MTAEFNYISLYRASHRGPPLCTYMSNKINSKSVDARRGTPQFVYSIFAEVADNCKFDSSRAEVISDNTVWEKYAPSLEIPKVKNSAKAIFTIFAIGMK